MKKAISLLLAVVLMAISTTVVFAEPQYTVVSETTQTFADGSSVTITVSKAASTGARASVVAGKKDYTYNKNGSVAWIFTLYGTFNIDGVSASCTKATYAFNGYQAGWRITSAYTQPSGNKAKGEATVEGTNTVYPSLTITCDGNGNMY